MLPAVSNASVPNRVEPPIGESGSNIRASAMSADLKDVNSALEIPLGRGEHIYSSSYQARLTRHRRLAKGPGEVPRCNPATVRRYDPSARSTVSSGMMSAHFTSDPLLSALRFQACASPNAVQNPNSEWADYVYRCNRYLDDMYPPPPVPREPEGSNSGCCVIL